MEISSIQALKAADINFGADEAQEAEAAIGANQRKQAAALCGGCSSRSRSNPTTGSTALSSSGSRSSMMIRKTAGMSVEEMARVWRGWKRV